MTDWRLAGGVLVLLGATACSGASVTHTTFNPNAPSPSSAAQNWTLTGRVVSTSTQQPIANAHLSPYNVTTTGDGRFSASGTGERTTRVTIDADGYVSRQTSIMHVDAPTLDLLPSSALDFYRQMVRNGLEAPNALQPVHRWTAAPQFYVSQDGSLSSEDLRRLTVGIQAAVAQLSPFPPPAITVGPARADQAEWVTLAFVQDATLTSCGRSSVGSNPGHIDLNLAPVCATRCPGGQILPGIVAHEVGHALGFWHTSVGLMPATTINLFCTGAISFGTSERQTAALAYQRPNGNSDPDTDPVGQAFLRSDHDTD